MTLYYHVNGELRPAEKATVNVRDRGFLYGDAAFETLRVYGGMVFEWDAHMDRLHATAETLGMASAVPSPEALSSRLQETLTANDLTDAYVRLSITRGVQPGKLTPAHEVDPTVVIIVSDLPRGGRGGSSVWDKPAVVRTVRTQRMPDEAIPAAAKTHNYLNGILARLELRRSSPERRTDRQTTGSENTEADPSADEALLCTGDGYLAEGTTSNVFFVTDGTLRTPRGEAPLLPGVTRQVVLDIASRNEVPVETGRYRPSDVRGATEAFLTNTTWELRPIGTIDGRPLSGAPGNVTDRLQERFDSLVEKRHY